MTQEEMAQEILDLESKLGNLDGDEYWIALYRIQTLARNLATLILQKEV